MAGYLKSSDLGPHGHGYGAPHPHHSAHAHGPLPPGMPMTSLPFGLPHGLDTSIGFPQGMWGKYQFLLCFTFYIFLILVKSWFWLQFAQFHSGKPVLYLKYVITSVLATHLMNKPLCLCASPKDWLFDRKMKWIRTENGVNKTIKCKLKSENFNTFVNRVIRIGQWLMSFSINVLFLFILSLSFDSYSFDMVALIPMSVRRRSVALNIQ